MANTHTSLFLPEEHKVISTWLDVEPAEELFANLTIEKALSDLNLLVPTVSVRSTVDWAVAAILLERIQDRLPQWASVSEGKATLGRNIRDRAADRTVEITPTHLITINWADSGPGFSWPEAYHVTYVPYYDEYIVTGSVDCTDVYGVTDFALGHFRPGEDIRKASAEIIRTEWQFLTDNYNQYRWAYLFDEALIGQDLADELADTIWEESGEPLTEDYSYEEEAG